MDLSGIDPLVLGVAVAFLLAFGLAIAWLMIWTSARRRGFEQRYGDEYDRAVAREGSHRRAGQTLAERDRRRAGFEVRPVPQREREILRDRWDPLQSSFLDSPRDAVLRARSLLDEVATAKGYPDADPDQRWDDLSYDHPSEVDRYRDCADRDRPSTESARQTMLAARALFEAMVGGVDTSDASARSAGYLRESDADISEPAQARRSDAPAEVEIAASEAAPAARRGGSEGGGIAAVPQALR